MPKMTADEITDFMKKFFPQARMPVEIEELRDGFLRIRVPVTDRYLRPGGTVSGPALMTIADTAMYYLVLGMIGPVALALTTNLNINFLRAPKLADVIAEAEMLVQRERCLVSFFSHLLPGLLHDGDELFLRVLRREVMEVVL